MAPRRCVVSLATEAKQYPAGLERLGRCLQRDGLGGEFLHWAPGELPEGTPSLTETPFAFKAFCLMEARRHDYDLLLWLDSSCVPVRTLTPLFEQIERDGYLVFQNYRWRIGQWCSDVTAATLGIDREEAMTWPEINAAAIGLNVRTRVGAEFLDRWFDAARDGTAFRGVTGDLRGYDDIEAVKWNRDQRASVDPRVLGHRFDQTVAGVFARRLGMTPAAHGLRDYSRSHRRIELRTRIIVDRDVAQLSPPLRSHEQVRRDKYVGYLVDPPPLRSSARRLIRSSARRLIRANPGDAELPVPSDADPLASLRRSPKRDSEDRVSEPSDSRPQSAHERGR
jgi:hypothetical protein